MEPHPPIKYVAFLLEVHIREKGVVFWEKNGQPLPTLKMKIHHTLDQIYLEKSQNEDSFN